MYRDVLIIFVKVIELLFALWASNVDGLNKFTTSVGTIDKAPLMS